MKQHVLILLITIGCLLTACSNANEKEAKSNALIEQEQLSTNQPIFEDTEKKGKSIPQTIVKRQNYQPLSKYKSFPITTDPQILGGQVFNVSEVKTANNFLAAFQAKQVLQAIVGSEVMFFPEEHDSVKLTPLSGQNALVSTIHQSYAEHRPLILSPDIIWFAICQGVSIHINENFDSLNKKIFTNNKPVNIKVRNDSIALSNESKHWETFIASLSTETRKHTKEDIYSFFVSEFSTTTTITKTAFQVALLESQSKAFRYQGDSGCGIPFIRLSGTTEDWQKILKKLDFLDSIGLEKWAISLRPVLEEFILAAQGKANAKFWQSIYKDIHFYDGRFISGWILKFFPYIKEEENFNGKNFNLKEVFKPNPFLEGNRYLRSTLTTENIPSGIAKINVAWFNHFKMETKQLEIRAGFFACRQYTDKSLEPFISWVITDKNAREIYNNDVYSVSPEYQSPRELWSPEIPQKVNILAIYDKAQFATQEKSIKHLRQLIIDSLKQHPSFNSLVYTNEVIEIELLSDGTIGKIEFVKLKNNLPLCNYIKHLLHNLPAKWSPAKAVFSTAFGLPFNMDMKIEKFDEQVNVNSLIRIKL